MILHPAIIALLVSSLLITVMMLYSLGYGFQILRKWDIKSGSELQLALERKTYLVSTVLSYIFAIQLISLFLYVFTANNLCPLFVGAMCAAGTLNVNAYGYPTLLLKIGNFILAGLWLVLNYTDNKAFDYPLIKTKYRVLMIIAPLIIAEAVLQTRFFLGLRADVITSCCGSLFSTQTKGIASDIASLPDVPMQSLFMLTMALTLGSGLFFLLKSKGGYLFAFLALLAFPVALASIISFISLYIYELPTHHCPFCVLMPEYGYIGYLLYLPLFGATVAGSGVGVILPFSGVASLKTAIASIARRLTQTSLALYLVFTILAGYEILSSRLIHEGY